MDDLTIESGKKRNPVLLFAGGCLGILYLALCILVLIVGRRQIMAGTLPTPTPTITQIPHILVRRPANPENVIHEQFSDNKYHWHLYYDDGKLELINGKLILQSKLPNAYIVGTSGYVSPKREKYYVQADFSTDIQTSHPYGLVFGSNHLKESFYFFEIQPKDRAFNLSKYDGEKWTGLIPVTETKINPFPHINTLSVYFDQGKMELYINGNQVAEYSDKEFLHSGDVGVFIRDTGYRLLVDDFFIYSEQ